MPYIKQEERTPYEHLISELGREIRTRTEDPTKRAGHLNYVITKLLRDVYGENLRYWQHNEIIGMLECCKEEFYRRYTATYEDECIERNGDV